MTISLIEFLGYHFSSYEGSTPLITRFSSILFIMPNDCFFSFSAL